MGHSRDKGTSSQGGAEGLKSQCGGQVFAVGGGDRGSTWLDRAIVGESPVANQQYHVELTEGLTGTTVYHIGGLADS